MITLDVAPCRVEDTDRARSTAESEAAVLEDLKWLGLQWDEGMHYYTTCKPGARNCFRKPSLMI